MSTKTRLLNNASKAVLGRAEKEIREETFTKAIPHVEVLRQAEESVEFAKDNQEKVADALEVLQGLGLLRPGVGHTKEPTSEG